LRKETPLIQVIDSPILPLEKHRIGRIRSFILGGFLACFIAIAVLAVKRIFKKIMA
jgi:hypothetical protein